MLNRANIDSPDTIWWRYNPAIYGYYVVVVFFNLKQKSQEIFALVSAQPMSFYLEPWRSLLTIQGTHYIFAANILINLLYQALEQVWWLTTVLFLFTEMPMQRE